MEASEKQQFSFFEHCWNFGNPQKIGGILEPGLTLILQPGVTLTLQTNLALMRPKSNLTICIISRNTNTEGLALVGKGGGRGEILLELTVA